MTRKATEDERKGMEWWNGLDEVTRRVWLEKVGTGRVADAWDAYKRTVGSNLHVLPKNADHETEELREILASKMEKIRAAQPTEADIQELKKEIAYLLDIAEGGSGQSEHVKNFLLAWWNAAECGGFDLTGLWAVDLEIAESMHRVFRIIANFRHYPDSPKLGFGERFEALAKERLASRQ